MQMKNSNFNFDPNDISHRTIETLFLQQIKLLTMRTQPHAIQTIKPKQRQKSTPAILEELSIKYL